MEEKIEISDILIKYNKLNMALEVLKEVREKSSSNKEVLYRIAEIYEKQGSYNKSLEILNEIKNIDSKDGKVYFRMAIIYEKMKELDKCDECLTLAIDNGVCSPEVFFYRGIVKEYLVKYNDSIHEYNKALRKNKTYMEARYRKYLVYMKLGIIEEAKVTLDEMIKFNGDQYDGYRIRVNLALEEGKSKEAYGYLEKARSVFNDYSPLKLDFIKYYIKEQKYEDALEIIENISDDEYYMKFMVIKSRILMMKDKCEEAIELLNDNRVYNEENHEVMFLLALLNYKVGNVKKAINNIDILCAGDELTSEYSKLAFLLKGYVYRSNKEKDRAKEHFKLVYKIFRIQSLSDPYNTSTLFLRILTLIEAKEFDKCKRLMSSLELLESVRFSSKIKKLEELIEIKTTGGNDEVNAEKNIVIDIFYES